MKHIHLCPSSVDDMNAFYQAIARAEGAHVHPLNYGESKLLSGTHADTKFYCEDQLADLRSFINTAAREHAFTIDIGYDLTSLFAAYYAVIASPHVTVNLLTPPAFGGETRYAKTHPFLIRKLLYNVLAKAARLTSPVPGAEAIVQEVYPRFAREIEFAEAVLPAAYLLPESEVIRDGIAVFTEFAPGGGVDRFIDALHKLHRIAPGIGGRPITLIGAGDIEQSAKIAAAFEAWTVLYNAPFNEYLRAAQNAEIVVLPDEPPHAGPTRELFAAIGAGAAIVAHERSAAVAHAGRGVKTFNSDDPLSLVRALAAAVEPCTTIEMMAATYANRQKLRNGVSHAAPSIDLDS